MPIRKAQAVWEGPLAGGKGTMALGSGAFQGKYSVGSRFEIRPGTNPEELIGAAHAGCFSMAFSAILGKAGFTPKSIKTDAAVSIDKVGDGFSITKIELNTVADIPGIDAGIFSKTRRSGQRRLPGIACIGGVNIILNAKARVNSESIFSAKRKKSCRMSYRGSFSIET